jgi:hypothetical protein
VSPPPNADSGRVIKFAYADPPYPGQAKRLYGNHPDYAGEVDHRELLERLHREYDGWALSTNMKSFPAVMKLCSDDLLALAWIKPMAPPMGDNRIYSWEPVILKPARRPRIPVRTHLVASPPGFTFRDTPGDHVIGEKPDAFAQWLFAAAGLLPSDNFDDLFPGSGAMGKAWRKFQGSLPMSPNGRSGADGG